MGTTIAGYNIYIYSATKNSNIIKFIVHCNIIKLYDRLNPKSGVKDSAEY